MGYNCDNTNCEKHSAHEKFNCKQYQFSGGVSQCEDYVEVDISNPYWDTLPVKEFILLYVSVILIIWADMTLYPIVSAAFLHNVMMTTWLNMTLAFTWFVFRVLMFANGRAASLVKKRAVKLKEIQK